MGAGLLVGLLQYGGAAVIQHYVLRLVLSYCSPAPFNLVRWLEAARQRGMLVRVGGGYRFYHELIQRHFADYEEPDYPRLPSAQRCSQSTETHWRAVNATGFSGSIARW